MWCCAPMMHRSSHGPNARSRTCSSKCGEHNQIAPEPRPLMEKPRPLTAKTGGNNRHRHIKQCRSKTRDAIESFLRLSIQDLQFAQRSNAPLLIVGNRRSYPAALSSQHPCTYLRSGVAAREWLDQPVGDASSGLNSGVFLRGNHDHRSFMIFYLPDRTTIRHSIDPGIIVLEYHERGTIFAD